MGLALVLPLLANSHGLAAQQEVPPLVDNPDQFQSRTFLVSRSPENSVSAPDNGDVCFATHNNGGDVSSSEDASAVQQAVDSASPGDTVKVAGICVGVQVRGWLTQTVYISKSLTLEGGHTPTNWTLNPDPGTYTTTLDANKGGRVIVISGTQDVTLDSLFLTGGKGNLGTLDEDGGGIWSNSGITLANSIVYSNTAQDGGGMYNLSSSPALSNVIFSHNSADISGGGMYNKGQLSGISPILKDVFFSGNSARFGGGMLNYGVIGECSPVLTKVIFSGNSVKNDGGAMYNHGYDGKSSPVLINVEFLSNSAIEHGGAIYNLGVMGESKPILTNITFSGNSAGGNGGGIYNRGYYTGECKPVVYNSILWNNQDSSGPGTISATIYNDSATISLTHSLVQGAGASGSGSEALLSSYEDGGGNIDTDPIFIMPVVPSSAPTTTGNLRLSPGSPAIDMGNNDYVTDVPTDLDGKLRIKDGDGDSTWTVDMGAYEISMHYTLTLTKGGTGHGNVTINPVNIDCGETCQEFLEENISVTLIATPDEESLFTVWSGDCSGSMDCELTMDTAKSIIVNFGVDSKYTLPVLLR